MRPVQAEDGKPGWLLAEIDFDRLYLVEVRHRQDASWQLVLSVDV